MKTFAWWFEAIGAPVGLWYVCFLGYNYLPMIWSINKMDAIGLGFALSLLAMHMIALFLERIAGIERTNEN